MDAERLIFASRHTLAQCRAVPDIVAEAWQAQALAQAIGGRLAVYGPPELRGEARGLAETGARGVGALDHPGVRSGGIRAARLSGMADTRATLLALGALLGEVGIALVAVACATDEEGLYWQCVEATDAADESSDRIRTMLRKLAVRDAGRGRPPDTSRGRPPDTGRGRSGAGVAWSGRAGVSRAQGASASRGAPRPADGSGPPGSCGSADPMALLEMPDVAGSAARPS